MIQSLNHTAQDQQQQQKIILFAWMTFLVEKAGWVSVNIGHHYIGKVIF